MLEAQLLGVLAQVGVLELVVGKESGPGDARDDALEHARRAVEDSLR